MSISPSFSNNDNNRVQIPINYAAAAAMEKERKQHQNNANWALAGFGATTSAFTLLQGADLVYDWNIDKHLQHKSEINQHKVENWSRETAIKNFEELKNNTQVKLDSKDNYSVWFNNAKELEAKGFEDLAKHTKKARLAGGIMAGAVALATIGGTAFSIAKVNETEKAMQIRLAEIRNREKVLKPLKSI
jgi:hypothetical protein